MNLAYAVTILCFACTSCARDQGAPPAVSATAPAAAGCISAGGGFLQAELRGAMTADLNWNNAAMQCAGGPRPTGKGLRMTLAGPLVEAQGAAHRLRFIFGIAYTDSAPGKAQALPTNLTLILEGEGRMYATRGDDHCAVETLERTPLISSGGRYDRVHVRGYCTEPATDMQADTRLFIPTFEFTGIADSGAAP